MLQNKYFQFFQRAISNKRESQLLKATWVYNSFNTSLIIASPSQLINYTAIQTPICMPGDYVSNFDPRCRIWYQSALKNQEFNNQNGFLQIMIIVYIVKYYIVQNSGQVFVEPYQFQFDGVIGMTISNKIQDKQGNLLSVLSIDYEISKLADTIFKVQDINASNNTNLKGYSVFFHEKNQSVFFHKDWSRYQSRTMSWEDIEFPQNLTYSGVLDDKEQFQQQVYNSINYSNNGNYSIQDMQNITPFFQSWSKNGIKYYSLVYPIQVTSILELESRSLKKQIVMFVGRVHRDIRNIFSNQNFIQKYDMLLFFLQTALILIIIFFALMHYAAVLYYQIDIPLRLLKTYLMQELQRQDINKKIEQQPNKDEVQKKLQQIPKQQKKYNTIRKSSNQDKGDSFNFENNEKNILEQVEQIPQIRLFKKHKTQINNVKQEKINTLMQSSHNFHQILTNPNQNSINNYNTNANQTINYSHQNIQQKQQVFTPKQQNNHANYNGLNYNFSPNNLYKGNNLRVSPDGSLNESKFIFYKNNKQQLNNQSILGTYNQIGSTNNLSMTQQNLINQIDMRLNSTVMSPNQAQNGNYKFKEFNQQQQGQQSANKITSQVRTKNHSSNHQQQEQQLSITRNTTAFKPIEINYQNSTKNNQLGMSQNLQVEKLENYQSSMMRLNASPRRKQTIIGSRFFQNTKHQEKEQQKTYMQFVAKQIRQIAIFSEKDMKEVLDIKLSDIPVMSHELKVIVSVFNEFSNVISYLEGGYEQTQNEWEKLRRLRQALKMFKYVKNVIGQSIVYEDIGNTYFDKDDYIESLIYYEQSLTCSLQQQGIQSIKQLKKLFQEQGTDPNNFRQYFLQAQNLDINFIKTLLFRLFVSGFAMREIGLSKNPCLIIQNNNQESLNWFFQSLEYFRLCLQICNLIHLPFLKKTELTIFIRLSIAEVYAYTHQINKSMIELKKSQILQQQYQEFYINFTRDMQQQQRCSISLMQIQNLIEYNQGVCLVQQRKFFQACLFFTSYLEKSTIAQFRKKALSYMQSILQDSNIDYSKIELFQNRLSHKHSYDIFILFHSTHESLSSQNLKQQSQQNINCDNIQNNKNSHNKHSKSSKNNVNQKQQNKGKSKPQVSQMNQIQLKILDFLNQNYLKSNDRVFFAGFDYDFKILQHLFPFENKVLWKKGENIIQSFLNKNTEQNSTSTQQNRKYSTLLNNISVSNNNNNQDSDAVYSTTKDRQSQISQSRKDSNQNSDNVEINSQNSKENNKVKWESSFFYMLKEMISYYKSHSIVDDQHFHKDKKIILLTFSFENSTQMISDVNQFEERVQQLTSHLPLKPKIINFFLPIIECSQDTQQNTSFFQKENNGQINEQQYKNIEELDSQLDISIQTSKSDTSFEVLEQQLINPHNYPKVFPKLKKSRNQNFRRDSLNIINSQNSYIIDNLYKDQSQSSASTNNDDFSLDKDSLNEKGKVSKKQVHNLLSTTAKLKSINEIQYQSGQSNNNYNKTIEKDESQYTLDNLLHNITKTQKVINNNNNDNNFNQGSYINKDVPKFNINLKKFYIFSNEQQIYNYLLKLRQKKMDLHQVLNRFLR